MSQTSRHEYLKMIQYHYHRASGRAAKAALLDQGVSSLGVGRKYLLRLLNAPTDSRPPKPRTGRPRTYGPAVLGVIKRLWLLMD